MTFRNLWDSITESTSWKCFSFACKYIHKMIAAVNSTLFLSFLQVFDKLRFLTCLQYSLICQAISGDLVVNQVFVILYKIVIIEKGFFIFLFVDQSKCHIIQNTYYSQLVSYPSLYLQACTVQLSA